MEKIWLPHYPAGVPAEIDHAKYPSVVALLEESFHQFHDHPAYLMMGKTLTFGDVDRHSRNLAAWLQSRGLKRGTRVALMMPNVLQYPVAVAAVLRAGLIVVNVNPMYTARELKHQLRDSGACAIIVLENFAHTVQQVLADTSVQHVVVASAGELIGGLKGMVVDFTVRHIKKLVPAYRLPRSIRFKTALRAGARMQLDAPQITADDVAVLQYTGGTTGVSKGAVLLHRNVVASVLAAEAWMQPGLKRRTITGNPTIVCALPLYHAFAFITCALLGARTGGVNILVPNPRDIGAVIDALRGQRVNVFPAVNTLFNALANHPQIASLDFSELAISNGGGSAIHEAVAKRWLEITGCPIVEGYGLSESCSGIVCNPSDNETYTGTIGLPMPSAELRILDDDGNDVPIGQPGEIAIRGPQVMRGYWNMTHETNMAMTPDGYFKSGDIGVMDERGYTRIVDRKKDMILVSGFNVYPNEIEAVVADCPGVLECAAIGVADANSGEAVKLYVVRKDRALTAEAIWAHLATQLTRYKRPRHIAFVEELPKSNVGKILRRELRDREARREGAAA